MKNHFNLNRYAGASLVLLVLSVTVTSIISSVKPQQANALPMNCMTNDDAMVMARMKSYGLNGDRSHIPEMLSILDKSQSTHPYVTYTVLHSLALLGVNAALPKFDIIAAHSDDVGLHSFAMVQRARLVAEASSSVSNQAGSADTKIKVLLKELGLAPTDLSPSCQYFHKEQAKHEMFPTVPVLAMREIADILYRSGVNPKSTSVANTIDFTSDQPSELKVRLSGMSSADRLNWLLSEISILTNEGSIARYEIQLAAESADTAAASADNLISNLQAQGSVRSSVSVNALLDVIDSSGSSKKRAMLTKRTSDHDPNITSHIQSMLRAVPFGSIQSPPAAHLAPGY